MAILRNTTIMAAVSVALSPIAAFAVPEPIADIQATASLTNHQVYVSGATAPSNVFNNSLILTETAGGIFSDDSIRRFTGETSEGTDNTITCGEITSTAADSITSEDADVAGKTVEGLHTVCVHKADTGSGDGTTIRASDGNSFGDEFLDIELIGGAGQVCESSTVVPATGNFQSYTLHTGCTDTVAPLTDLDIGTKLANNLPDGGVADVEPALFDVVGGLETDSIFTLIWGLQASIPFYKALQTVQFPYGDECNPIAADQSSANLDYDSAADPDADTDTTDGVSNEAKCVPSIKRSDVVSIFTGQLTDIREFNSGTGVALTAAPGVVTPPDLTTGPTTPMYLCRRKDSSGTEKSYEANYLRENCGVSGILTMRPGTIEGSDNLDSSDGDGKDIVASRLEDGDNIFEADGSSDVVECVSEMTTLGQWAIGINSTEKLFSAESPAPLNRMGYRHLRVNGVLPTAVNTTAGHYDIYSEVVCNTRTGEDSSALGAELVRELLCDGAPSTDIIAGFGVINQPWGQAGALGIFGKAGNTISAAEYPLNETDLAGNPVSLYTKSAIGFTNNCQPSVKAVRPVPIFFPGAAVATPATNTKDTL